MLPFYSNTCIPPSGLTCHFLVTMNLLIISIMLSFQERYINEIIENITFWHWLFSLGIILQRFIQVAVNILLSFVAEWYSMI